MANQFTKKYTDRQLQNHRKKWVKALRSGDYEQTTACLKDESGFCCLGVACDVSGLGKWDGATFKSGTTKNERSDDVLTSKVRSWLGIRTSGGNFTPDEKSDYYETLMNLNDDVRWDFNQIADFIESNPKGLFI